jgi:GNAT superfamily N-acetyltransferase
MSDTTATATQLTIREATAADVDLIQQFIRGLAEYERAPDSAIATREDLLRYGFGTDRKYRCMIAEWEGTPAGFALFFNNFSTWFGRPGIYLEDLFIRPEFRTKGIGKAMLRHLAQIALRENCYGLRWMVLDWNEPAIRFYETIGAEEQGDWVSYRLMGDALKRFAGDP